MRFAGVELFLSLSVKRPGDKEKQTFNILNLQIPPTYIMSPEKLGCPSEIH